MNKSRRGPGYRLIDLGPVVNNSFSMGPVVDAQPGFNNSFSIGVHPGVNKLSVPIRYGSSK